MGRHVQGCGQGETGLLQGEIESGALQTPTPVVPRRGLARFTIEKVQLGQASAEIMSIGQVAGLMDRGAAGEVAAVSYVNGLVDGIMGMEALHNKEKGVPFEFCKIQEAHASGTPIQHPAFETKEIIRLWKQSGQPMDTLAVDVILGYLTWKYGCK